MSLSTALRLAASVALVGLSASAEGVLFDNGNTDWKIFLSPQAGPTERHAAQELQRALKIISGADFEIGPAEREPESKAIIVGALDHPQVRANAAKLKLSPNKVEQVAVYTLGGQLYLAGNQPRGALYAVCSFLQRQLGVRWLWPGPSGEFIPRMARWTLPALAFNHTPAIPYRGFHLCGDWRDHQSFRKWMARNFINIHRHAARRGEEGLGFYSMWSSHNARLRDKTLWAQHPEYFAEVAGVRYQENICLSHPAVDKIVADSMAAYVRKHPGLDILSIFPSDNQTYCRCDACGKMDVSTAWFEFYNRLTDVLTKQFPDLRFSTIAYQGYRDVPKCRVRNCEFVEYASYMRCNAHPFGQPGCKRNEEILAAFLEWKNTGLAIGNYAYEYDIFSRNSRFAPFLSMVDDAIKTAKRLGHVTMIPEVVLSPKRGPEVYVRNVQNRLSIYLYARLLWDPDQELADLLRDWCRTAFGGAAIPMFDYYTRMDQAWTAMPVHPGILGDALSVVDAFLVGKLEEEAVAKLAAADRAVLKTENAAARERAVSAIAREKTLFRQWLDLLRSKNPKIVRLNLPLLAQTSDFPGTACRAQALASATAGASSYPTEVSAAWTQDSLLVKWICHDPQIGSLRARAANRDGEVAADDSVELVLPDAITGKRSHFLLNAKGIRQDYRAARDGTREDQWNPDWQATARIAAKRWEADLVIPFSSLGQTPNPNETRLVRFLRHNGGRDDFAPASFPVGRTAVLSFSGAARTDRPLLWWCGAPERESRRAAALSQAFTEAGWQFNRVTTPEALFAAHEQCRVFWFRHPNGPNRVPADYWEESLAPAVRNGALAVFASYWNIPLETYFGDPSFKVKVVTTGKLPLAGRRSVFLAPGDWSIKPNNLLRRLRTKITPAYGFVPDDPAAWTVLATAPRSTGDPYPYLLARSYGKGTVILCGDNIPISRAQMLENFVEYHEKRQKHE